MKEMIFKQLGLFIHFISFIPTNQNIKVISWVFFCVVFGMGWWVIAIVVVMYHLLTNLMILFFLSPSPPPPNMVVICDMEIKKALGIIGIVFHVLVMIVILIVFITILEIYSTSINNDNMERNIFVAISCFGIIVSLFLLISFIDSWKKELISKIENIWGSDK